MSLLLPMKSSSVLIIKIRPEKIKLPTTSNPSPATTPTGSQVDKSSTIFASSKPPKISISTLEFGLYVYQTICPHPTMEPTTKNVSLLDGETPDTLEMAIS